ncbi:MAG: hypothetical protein VW804_07845 [Verrucomicrobiota bacterium]
MRFLFGGSLRTRVDGKWSAEAAVAAVGILRFLWMVESLLPGPDFLFYAA